MKRFFSVLFLFILGCLMVAYAVANRSTVEFVLDPFDPSAPLRIEVKLYVLLFVTLFVGAIAGWIAAWLGQGHWRKKARDTHKEATIWKREAENLKRGLEAVTPKSQASNPRALRSLS